MKLVIISVICILLLQKVSPYELNITKCPRQSADLGKCLSKSIIDLLPQIKNGVPDKGIPRLEPFEMSTLEINSQIPGITIHGVAKNIVANGATAAVQINSMIADVNKNHVEVDLVIGHVDFTANYDIKGSKILMFEVSGTGKIKGDLNGIHVKLVAEGHVKKRNGKDYLKLDTATTDINIERGVLDPTPDGDNLINKAAAKYINENSDKVLTMVKPEVDKMTSDLVMKFINNVLRHMSLDEFLE